jgi:hypothetical protein
VAFQEASNVHYLEQKIEIEQTATQTKGLGRRKLGRGIPE